jgi:hypothetical protein
MKPEQQRIAIAEACGWKCSEYSHELGQLVAQFIPDYLNDLNAMHQAEEVLFNQFNTIGEAYWRNLSHVEPHPIYATAAQRAEAFLKTVGKWEEEG